MQLVKGVTATITEGGNLRLTADTEAREALREASADYYKQETMISEELHERYEFIRPEEVGALTDAPILCEADGIDYGDEHQDKRYGRAILPDAKVYWYPSYMVRNPWDELAERGEVIFTAGD